MRIVTNPINEGAIPSCPLVGSAIVGAELTLPRANHHYPDQLRHHSHLPRAERGPVPCPPRTGPRYVMTRNSTKCDMPKNLFSAHRMLALHRDRLYISKTCRQARRLQP
jgi:hypothetical protein